MRHSKNKFSKFLLIFSILLNTGISLATLSPAEAMETIFVSSNQKTGRYSGPIYVKLTASNPEAKIWYTCRRDGTPNDLIEYKNPILLTKSCAMVYFAYVTTELESKIERTDFTILYSDEVKLETNDRLLQLRNTGNSTVDIGGWELIAGSGGITIPPGTTLTPEAIYIVGKVDPASYELKSPEGYIKSQVSVVAPTIEIPPKKLVAKVKPVVSSQIDTNIGDTNISVLALPSIIPTQSNETGTTSNLSPDISKEATIKEESNEITSGTQTSRVESEVTPIPENSNELNTIKASASESKNTSNELPIIVTVILLAGGAIIGKRFQTKK